MAAMWARGFERLVVSCLEKVRPFTSQRQQSVRKLELDLAVWPGGGEVHPVPFARLQKFAASRKIDRPPVVRIDEGQVPKLCSLVKVRHAWQRRLEYELRQGI